MVQIIMVHNFKVSILVEVFCLEFRLVWFGLVWNSVWKLISSLEVHGWFYIGVFIIQDW